MIKRKKQDFRSDKLRPLTQKIYLLSYFHLNFNELNFFMHHRLRRKNFFCAAIFFGLISPVLASANSADSTQAITNTFLWLALILLAAKLATLVERLGQPAVLGELIIGVLL